MTSTKGLLLAGFAVLVLPVLACGRSPTSPSTNIAGTYTLISAGGQRLPAVVSGNPGTNYVQEVTGGFVELRADQTFTWSTDYRYTMGGQVSTTTSSGGGRYSMSGTALTFTSEPGSEQLTATLDGEVLTITADVELVYRKQG